MEEEQMLNITNEELDKLSAEELVDLKIEIDNLIRRIDLIIENNSQDDEV